MKISASFLTIQEPIKENIEKLVQTDIDYLHLDIMDGKFVPNTTWNIEEIKKFISLKKTLDIHLMVEDVYTYIDEFSKLNPTYLTFHYEVEHDIMEMVNYVRKKGSKVGVSIKPATPIESIYPILPFIDLVLVMSVEPGKGGQLFQKEAIDRIEKLYTYRKEHSLSFQIEVDGGINKDTLSLVDKADIVVVGSYITNGDYKDRVSILKKM